MMSEKLHAFWHYLTLAWFAFEIVDNEDLQIAVEGIEQLVERFAKSEQIIQVCSGVSVDVVSEERVH